MPTLNKLNLYLNFFTAQKFATHKEQKTFAALDSLENLLSHKEGDYKIAADFTRQKAKEFSFFNYEIEFPEIRNGKFNGFQAIVGNPPWDKTKFSDNDFFPQFKSDYRTLSNSKKAEFKTNQLAKPYIKAQYDALKASIESTNEYYKAHFPLNAGDGDGNLFRFFVERNLSLLESNASLNYVLPSALMLEKGSYNLRKEILTNYTMSVFYAFENREGIFHKVHRSYKFALMQVTNAKPPKNHSIKTMFYKTNIDEIYKRENIISLSLAQIRALSPEHLALQEVRSKRDLEILGRAYNTFAPLDCRYLDFRRELDMTNDKDLFIEMDSLLSFAYNPSLRGESKSPHPCGGGLGSGKYLPLYEGKKIHQFNAEFSAPNYFLDKDAFDNRLKSKEIHRLKQDLGIDSKEYDKLLESLYQSACHSERSAKARSEESQMAHKDISPTAQYDNKWAQYDKENSPSLAEGDKGGGYKSAKDSKNAKFSNSDSPPPQTPSAREGAFERFPRAREGAYDKATFESSLIRFDREYFRLGFRAIASDTNERTLIFSLLPKDCGFGHTMYGLIPKRYILDSGQICTQDISYTRICFALGIFNSLVVDYIARAMIQISVDKTYITRIPLPQPSDDEIAKNETYAFIARSALILQLYNDKAGHFAELAQEFGIKTSEIPTTQKLYDSLKAQLDIKVAKLYGLDFSDFEHILESFKVLNAKQPAFVALLKDLFPH